jgi:hypothetical protein
MKNEKIWIGRWLGAVAALHTLFALVVFAPIYQRLLQHGWFDSVGEDPLLNAGVWFVLFGAPLALLAQTIHTMEKNGAILAPKTLGWGLLLLTLFGISLMPASGFWLVFPPAFVLLLKQKQAPKPTFIQEF